jgi:hypothetical protein
MTEDYALGCRWDCEIMLVMTESQYEDEKLVKQIKEGLQIICLV